MGYAPERTWRVLYEGYGKGMTESICMEKRNGTKKIYEERYVVRNTKTLGKKKQSTNYMLKHGTPDAVQKGRAKFCVCGGRGAVKTGEGVDSVWGLVTWCRRQW